MNGKMGLFIFEKPRQCAGTAGFAASGLADSGRMAPSSNIGAIIILYNIMVPLSFYI